jgi:hypothetical protein
VHRRDQLGQQPVQPVQRPVPSVGHLVAAVGQQPRYHQILIVGQLP